MHREHARNNKPETIMKTNHLFCFAALLACISTSALAQSDVLDKIKKDGVIKIGVKTNYQPFGMLNSSGKIIGIEPDLAADIGKQMGVKVELVPVESSNRIQFLQQGRIDVLIATLGVSAERVKVVNFIQPYYYASGTGLLVRPESGIKAWEDLKGKTLCGVQGTYYNRPVSEKYGATVSAFANISEAQTALKNGSCIGLLDDSIVTGKILMEGKLPGYVAPLPPGDPQPWGLATALSNKDSALAKNLSTIVTGWHKSGKILALEKAAGLPESKWLLDAQQQVK